MGNLKVKSLGIYQKPFKTRAWIESVHSALVVVAHPDDETLWVGGTMMMVPACRWRVVSLCRGDDPDRRSRFFTTMTRLNGQGSIGDMKDGHLQPPLSDDHVKEAIRSELENTNYDLIITHSLFGEYTTHLRHNEVGRAMLHLWQAGELTAKQLWMFAYSDKGGKARYPTAIENAHLHISLPEQIWTKKLAIIQEVYGFASDSWEVMTTPRKEAFWRFLGPAEVPVWQKQYGLSQISKRSVNGHRKRNEK
jgi:LmbE family N-acetylglucosaminyl deacetylase